MTSDFKPGKAYLIEGKGVEQVKDEIKEWFKGNKLEIVIDKENEIGADKKNFMFNYEVWIHLKLMPSNKGTIVVFSDEFNYFYSGFFVNGFLNLINLGLGFYMQELRKNLIRYLLNKNQIKIDFQRISFNFFPFSLATFIIFGLLIIYSPMYVFRSILINIIDIQVITLIVLILSVLGLYLIHLRKNRKKANLPEYYVEEYKGEIEID
ncbi:MAG TPA: hypothetical protein PLI06_06190 [Methanofastidiosum sp.]|nr:hypothetical protein [Methanofastidiosum sp.]